MPEDKETDTFDYIVRKLHLATRDVRWRALYRTMHNMGETRPITHVPALIEYINSDFLSRNYKNLQETLYKYYATYQMGKLGVLQFQYGRGIRRLANRIMRSMISSILENDDDLMILNYNLLSMDQRIEFITRTLMATHQKISEHIPSAAPALTNVKLDTEYNKRKKRKPNESALAYYSHKYKHIGLCPPLFESDDINEIINVMTHEYVHVLQSVYKSSLPLTILRYADANRVAMFRLPHDVRPIELESNRVADMVTKKFLPSYEIAVEKYNDTHDM